MSDNFPSSYDPDTILVSVAWPYANGPFHAGHVSGVYLPADTFARFQRTRGRKVLMVSGSDCHGTPITLRAERENRTPQEVVNEFHTSFLKTFNRLGIEFDLFTKTLTENHYAVTQDMFLRLLEHGYIYREKMIGAYSPSLSRFLPDRYVEGECYNCHFGRARGDQCDNCGILVDPQKLINPYSVVDRQSIEFRETEHFFLDLAKLEPFLRDWINSYNRDYWRNNTTQFTLNWLNQGLRGRAITRDLEWGVPIPLDDPSFKDKRIYVWFDAVIGYFSASKEWAQRQGKPELWENWWHSGKAGKLPARQYYFLGKDNIPFHTIIWPAMLIGYGELNLPFDVPASEFMNLEGDQMSTSRNWAIWLPDIEERYQPDAIRYYMTAIAPETRDSSWSWKDFVAKINNELIGTYGNFINRVLNPLQKNFGGLVPTPGELDESDHKLLAAAQETFARVTELLEGVHLRDALKEVMALASLGNGYLEEKSPWKVIKQDVQRAGTTYYVAAQIANALKIMSYPFLPFSAEKLHAMLGFAPGNPEVSSYSGVAEDGVIKIPAFADWALEPVPAGQVLPPPTALFIKLEPSVADEELALLNANKIEK
ncbi:methionine--tRNA ligase [Candidatus Chlorohelix sp.]|uniref:methionine--tRNA ligase n=1 Tax=Candidatus Chlorohelix sp. TaxID=3139201 RepID=UPI00303AD1A7